MPYIPGNIQTKKYIYKLIVLRTMKVRKHKPKSMYITARAYKA